MSPRIESAEQTDRVEYVGHATTLLRLGGVFVLTDPFLGGWLGPLRRQGAPPSAEVAGRADLALVSHIHRDHLDLPSLRKLGPKVPVVVPCGATRLLSRLGPERITELGVGETAVLSGVSVTAVPALHDGHRDRWGETVEPVGYLIESEGARVYFAGDTDLFVEMSELGQVDLALLPVWGWGPTLGKGLHLDPRKAAEAVRRIRPRVAVPIHWGTFYPLGLRRVKPEPLSEPPFEFARMVAQVAPEVRVQVLQPGGMMEL